MDFFNKCDQIRRNCEFVYITEEIHNENNHFLCSDSTTHKVLKKRFKTVLPLCDVW